MSAQQLDDRTAELGMRIPRSVLANLESGRRETISVAELMTLAAALEVPPVLLLFPVGKLRFMKVLPGAPMAPWDAFRWFVGERELTIFAGQGGKTPYALIPAEDDNIKLFRDHDLFQRSWQRAWWALQNATKAAREAGTEEEAQAERATAASMTEQVNAAEDDLRMIRRRMRETDLIPPPLFDELAHVDDTPWSRAVSVTAVLPVQVLPVAEILGMGRPVLLDLTEMELSDRDQVTELLFGLTRDISGTAERLADGKTLRLTPGGSSQVDDQAFTAFRAALEALPGEAG